MSAARNHAVATVAFVSIAGWLLLLVGFLWWTFQPVALTSVAQPVEVLNAGNEIAIGTPIVLRLVVDKPEGIRAVAADRFLECDSGNLVTLTSSTKDLPPGSYTIINDKTILPAKVAPGDVCVFTFRNTYQVNPIRTESAEWRSEPFTVLPAVKAG